MFQDGLPPARLSASCRQLNAGSWRRPRTAAYWLDCWVAQSVGPGRVWEASLYPGMLCRAAARAIRARPSEVRWAASTFDVSDFAAATASVWSAKEASRMPESGARSVRSANTGSRVLFQLATPPCTSPHIDSEPSNRPACRSASIVVTKPPYEVPQARVRPAAPNFSVNRSSVASWSGTASAIAQPFVAYEEPMSAYPSASSLSRTAGPGVFWAGLGAPAGV